MEYFQTELHGLQWKRFGDQRTGDAIKDTDLLPDAHLRDSILLSYGKCLNANLLAAWNRVPSNNPANLPVCKKLWIFWYGEEPDLSQLLSPDLSGMNGFPSFPRLAVLLPPLQR